MDIFSILNMLCGLALFLYGMNVMGEGLSRASGGRLENILETLTSSRLKAVLLGAAVTAVVQSSSATTVMVVGFVNSGIMRLTQATGVIVGANIGAAVTNWLLALTGIQSDNMLVMMCKPSSFTPILAMVGIVFMMFTKSEKKHNIGTVLIGFTVLMTGMETMSSAVEPLAGVPEFTNVLIAFSNPVLGTLSGLALTAIIQSSSASVGILQALCATGVVSNATALPIIMGANIGTCVTALLSSVGASKNAKRAALIHLYFNIIGTLLFMAAFYSIHALFPFGFMENTATAASVAVIHTVYKLSASAVLLPFSGALEKLAMLTVRDDETVGVIDEFKLLDERFLSKPAFAVEQCRVVADRMAQLTREAIFDAISLLDGEEFSEEKAARVEALEAKIDLYEDKLGTYMVKLSRQKLSRSDGHRISLLLHSISDFERISDHAVNLLDSAREMANKKMAFSPMAANELHVFSEAVKDIVGRSVDCFLHDDVALAKTVEPLEACIDELNVTIKSRHIERLTTGQCTIQLGFVLTDISTNFERVSDHCSNIAIYQIQVPNDEYDTHEYLLNMKRTDHAEFDREEGAYEKKYSLPPMTPAEAETAE